MHAHFSDVLADRVVDPASPGRPHLRRSAWRGLWVCTAVWLLFCLLLVLAQTNDAAKLGRTQLSFGVLLKDSLPLFPPFLLLSWCLFMQAQSWPRLWSSPAALLKNFVVCISVFMVVWTGYVSAIDLWQNGKPLSLWWQHIGSQRWFNRFYDFVLASSSFAVQAGLCALGAARKRELDWRREQTDNLRLRLTLLQGQLEPHFLFNALNSISALVRGSDRSTALSALSRVSELLRYALRASRSNWVTVQDELDFVRDYLALQRLRFGEGLQVRWTLQEGPGAPAWAEIACPPLIFQPLIENAIRHGLEAHEGQGVIELSLSCPEPGRLVFLIRNPLPAEAARQPGHGLGLSATRQRLTMLYGEQAQLHSQAMPQSACFETELTLPCRDAVHEEDSERAGR